MRVPGFVRSRIIAPSDPAAAEVSSKVLKQVYPIIDKIVSWLRAFQLFIKLQQLLQNLLINILAAGPVPQHISFIMDGNRRFAKKMNMPVKRGHEAGGVTLLSLCYVLKKMGVRCVSAYAFSIENFNRPPEEVNALTNMFAVKLDEFARKANDYRDPLYQSRLKIVGDHSLISEEMREKIKRVEEMTNDGDEFTLFICFPYTSRNDIWHATQTSVEECVQQSLEPRALTVEEFNKKMYLNDYSHKCDLLIRTSGHLRLSDYMLWQVHESGDIKFSPTLWPDFKFFQLYLMILNWSFFTTIQRYIFHGSKKSQSKPAFWNRKKSSKYSLEDLPAAPVAVSITGERDPS
ncbi:hypothetical protein ZYGR_0Z01060 [Zygosaccharomyces rouxii]|uniref:Alkyl transferase n=1 Tax=Zygosaccharomyces rouxii TaxID=4956 RepID=A0A1Q3A4W4_ZYGRO|nr:hypothetical protein ZYGR_0Z01060 [Zygosaccharomyces rouxii]